MTQEEVKAKSAEKAEKVKAFLTELQVVIEAKQQLTPNMTIENVVIFRDEEMYPIAESNTNQETQNAEPTDIQQ